MSYDELYGRPRAPHAGSSGSPSAAPDQAPGAGRFGAMAAIVGCLILTMAAIAGRTQVVKAAPMTARAYAAIGLPVNIRGLDIRHVKALVFDDSGRKTLGVEGEIVNLTAQSQPIPELSFGLRGETGREIYSWTSAAQVNRIEKDSTILFRARLASPPDDAQDVLVRFVKAAPKPESPNLSFRGTQSP